MSHNNEPVVNKQGVVIFNPNIGISVAQNDEEQDESPDHLPPSVFNNRVVFKSNGHALRNFVVKERLIVKDNAHIQGVLYASTLNNGTNITLPTNDGFSGQVLMTDGNGTLSWVAQDQGPRGEAFQVDEFNVVLDDTKVTLIESSSSASSADFYVFVVSADARTSPLPGIDTTGNLTDLARHVVAYNGSTYADYGPFTGPAGAQGETGALGDT